MSLRVYPPDLKIRRCLSTARPSNPVTGQMAYETDTGNLIEYQGATDTWTPPWNTAWGLVTNGSQTATSNQGGITTEVDLTSISVTWTGLVNRMYLAIVTGILLASTAGTVTTAEVRLKLDGALISYSLVNNVPATGVTVPALILPFPVSAASHTVKATAVVTSGGGTMTTVATATAPLNLSIQDLGKTGASS